MMEPEVPGLSVAPEEPRRDPPWDWSDAALFAALAAPCLLLALALSRGVLMAWPKPHTEAMRAMSFQFIWYALWFSALVLILRLRYSLPFWSSLGWVIPWRGLRWTLFAGPVTALVVAVGGALLRTPVINNPIQNLLVDGWSLALVGLFAVFFGPIAEELAFRGFLLPLLVRSAGPWAAIAACNVLFAALHGPQYSWTWQHIILLFAASTVFCLVRLKTGSTAAAALAHATYNLTFFTGFVIQERGFPF